MRLACVLVLAALLAAPPGSAALRALMVFPFGAHSHYTMFKAMADALLERGHEVVMFSQFPPKKHIANFTHVDTTGSMSLVSVMPFEVLEPLPIEFPPLIAYKYMEMISIMAGDHVCEHVLAMPEIHKMLAGGYGKFDVVMTEAFGADCWAGLAYRLQLPIVSMASGPDWPWIHERVGSPDNPSYLINVFSGLLEPMSFKDRLYNFVFTVSMNYMFQRKLQDGTDATMRKYLGEDLPPQREIVNQNTSLILLNRHVSINAARPVTPNIVHVGGLHVQKPPGTLDPSLREWMDGAEHGVIFFSLGSILKASTMPPAMRDLFLWAFERVPQRVVWKFESDNVTLPSNVRVASWLPQMDVLSHPKTMLFITHGGLMGTQEALHCGIPMLGVPLFGDQGVNMDMYKGLGIAEFVDHHTMTKESFLAALKNLTENKRYQTRAREVSEAFKDRPREAADEAVWWVEYVVRHRGAPFMRSRSIDMPLYQYLLLDVLAFLFTCGLIAVLAGALVTWRMLALLRRLVAKAAPKAKEA